MSVASRWPTVLLLFAACSSNQSGGAADVSSTALGGPGITQLSEDQPNASPATTATAAPTASTNPPCDDGPDEAFILDLLAEVLRGYGDDERVTAEEGTELLRPHFDGMCETTAFDLCAKGDVECWVYKRDGIVENETFDNQQHRMVFIVEGDAVSLFSYG